MENNTRPKSCKCSGTKKLDPNAIKLEESTVEFYQMKNGDETHYCFDAITLSDEDIILNAKLGQELLANNDKLVISTKESIMDKIEVKENCNAEQCVMEDNNYYTVISVA